MRRRGVIGTAARTAKIQLAADVVDGLILLYAGRSPESGKTMYEHCVEIGQIPSMSLAQVERKTGAKAGAKPRVAGALVPVLPVS